MSSRGQQKQSAGAIDDGRDLSISSPTSGKSPVRSTRKATTSKTAPARFIPRTRYSDMLP